jgi:nitrite reductase (NADH) small subunit
MAKWIDVCSVDDLQPNSGVCALLDGEQVAIFWMPALRLRSGQALPSCSGQALGEAEGVETKIYAVGNYDPFGNANVLSRGLIGDIGGQPVVASPLYKQHFNLQTGVCLEDESVKIPVYAIRIENLRVQVDLSSLPHHGA